MHAEWRPGWQILVLALSCFSAALSQAESVRVATYNLEGYLDIPTETRSAKAAESKAKVREIIRALRPDVLALEEMGTPSALLELRESLKREGLDFPHWEHISGPDTNIHVAVLSKFPFAARRPRTNENFLLHGRRFRVSRGFAEVDIQVSPTYNFTLLVCHLKSRLSFGNADAAELRLEEARLLRERVDACFDARPEVNLVVAGDFNDTRDSAPLKTIMGRGKRRLVDTRPSERDTETPPDPKSGNAPRSVAWTHHFAKEDVFSRIDYILLSPGMAREWLPAESYVPSYPGWGKASDHRPVLVTVLAEDK